MTNPNAISSVSSYKETTTDYQNYGRWISQLQQKMQEISDEQEHASSSQEEERDESTPSALQQQAAKQDNDVKVDGINRPTTYHRLDTYV